MHTRFAYNAISVAGKRPRNEDAWGARWYGETLFCAVADGIGGYPAGDVASSHAIHEAEETITRALSADTSPDYASLLRQAHLHADEVVKKEATGPKSGMGTTLTTALFHNSTLTVCNTGDSRCSIVRDGRLIPITRDHSLVQEQIDAGRISPDEAFGHPQKHIITRSIGSLFAADVTKTELCPADVVILSTDGMHDYLTPAVIVREANRKTAHTAATALLNAAVPVSEDNITVCVVTVSEN